jgi:O-methyltransferase
LQPVVRGLRKRWQQRRFRLEEPYATVYPYTQVSASRQKNLARLAGIVEAEALPGAVVECGVLDGGTAGLMAHFTAASGRAVHLFDAWKGLPRSTAEDSLESKKWEGQVVGSRRRVARLMARLGVDTARVRYHVGWFHETFPSAQAKVGTVALLHIDCDFHDPVKLCLDTWFSAVVPGGFIQFDDYSSFVGCRRAVDDFLATHTELRLEEFASPDTAFYLRKL